MLGLAQDVTPPLLPSIGIVPPPGKVPRFQKPVTAREGPPCIKDQISSLVSLAGRDSVPVGSPPASKDA